MTQQMTIKEIRMKNLKLLIKESGLSQGAFALRIQTSPAYLSQMFSEQTKRSMGDSLARKIEVFLLKPKGWMDTLHTESEPTMQTLPPNTNTDLDNVRYISLFEKCLDSAKVTEDDVLIHIIDPESAISADSAIEHAPRILLRVSKRLLASVGVAAESAYGFIVQSNSMAPLLPEGAIIAIDRKMTSIKDGEIYLINHAGHLRIISIYHQIGGGLRLRSFNSHDWPDEMILPEQWQMVNVLGRVFCWSVLR